MFSILEPDAVTTTTAATGPELLQVNISALVLLAEPTPAYCTLTTKELLRLTPEEGESLVGVVTVDANGNTTNGSATDLADHLRRIKHGHDANYAQSIVEVNAPAKKKKTSEEAKKAKEMAKKEGKKKGKEAKRAAAERRRGFGKVVTEAEAQK